MAYDHGVDALGPMCGLLILLGGAIAVTVILVRAARLPQAAPGATRWRISVAGVLAWLWLPICGGELVKLGRTGWFDWFVFTPFVFQTVAAVLAGVELNHRRRARTQ